MTLTKRHKFNVCLLLLLALVPMFAELANDSFFVGLLTRILILAIAATSLNLLIGFGGIVSFSQATFIGVGAYTVGIGSFYVFENDWLWMGNGYYQLLACLLVSALLSLVIGALSLRTQGVYFIMITIAFSQMFYFVAVGLDVYGGDEGLPIYQQSDMLGLIDLGSTNSLYYLCFLSLVATLWFFHKVQASRFGQVIAGTKSNKQRMLALGFSPYQYQLTAFVISGVFAGYSGFLLANLNEFVSPDTMHWTRSCDLIIMIVLGGMGCLYGPLYGALLFLLLEELLSSIPLNIGGVRIGEYWQLILGPVLILIVLYTRNGFEGLLSRREYEH